jgi:predicted nucleic-acid-binding protein
MMAIDANILLRLILRDDEEQVGRVKAFLKILEAKNRRALVLTEVVAEMVYVLEKQKRIEREIIVELITGFMDSEFFEFEHDRPVRCAFAGYLAGGGFVDELIAARAGDLGADGLFSFDMRLVSAHPDFVFDLS